jgi:hypothetical protein
MHSLLHAQMHSVPVMWYACSSTANWPGNGRFRTIGYFFLCVCVCFVLEREESIAIDRVELYWHEDIEKYKTSTEMHRTIDGDHRWYRHCVGSQPEKIYGWLYRRKGSNCAVHVELAIVATDT